MKYLLALLFSIASILNFNAQTYNPFYGDIVENTSTTNVLNDLITFEDFGIKQLGTTALTNTQNWIVARYQSLGYTDIALQPFSFNGHSTNNIIITKTGTIYPNTFLIIDAHFDTINGPGTNDNGTGTVLLLELARLLKDVDTEYSIKFIHFSGEENGLIGSNYYVDTSVNPQNMDIKLVFNIDEVGGVSGMVNDTVVCERDESNPQSNNEASNVATAILANCMELYSDLDTEISYAYASDYMPFENNGNIITGLYEKNISPVNHTSNDLLVNMDPDYAFQVVKGALGAALHFAVAYDSALGITDAYNLEPMVSVYPNPAHKMLHISFKNAQASPVDFRLMTVEGKEVLNKRLTQQQELVPIDSLSKGNYLAVFKIENQRAIRKVIIN